MVRNAAAVAGLVFMLTWVGCTKYYMPAPSEAQDAQVCPQCKGTGYINTCAKCQGKGYLEHRNKPVIGATEGEVIRYPCPACNGTGMGPARACPLCGRTGKVYELDEAGEPKASAPLLLP